MTVSLWRIGTDTPSYAADDLSGKGAQTTGGRWNSKGRPVLYTASNVALAAMETIVHFNTKALPLNRYLVRIDVPDDLWTARERHLPTAMPVGWDACPAGLVSINFGDEWLNRGGSLLLELPSVVVPEESNVLVNPRHPDAGQLSATKLRRWIYDARIRPHK